GRQQRTRLCGLLATSVYSDDVPGRADEVGQERRCHADAAPQICDSHPALEASLEKHTAATRLIEAVAQPKPGRGRRAGCENVLASDVSPGILIHRCRSRAAAAAYFMPATSRVAARYQAPRRSPALAVGLTSAVHGSQPNPCAATASRGG